MSLKCRASTTRKLLRESVHVNFENVLRKLFRGIILFNDKDGE